MIWLTRVDGSPVLVNEAQIVLVEPVHDSILHLASGLQIRVRESVEEVARRVARASQQTLLGHLLGPEPGAAD